MAVISALRAVPQTLRAQPVLFFPVVLLFLVPAGQHLIHQLPLVGPLVSLALSGLLLVAFPLFYGGIIGMIDEAVTSGQPTTESFIRTAKHHYVPLLVVSGLVLGTVYGLFMANVVFSAIVVAVAGLVSFQARLLTFAPFVVGSLVATVLCQFCGHAIVIENRPAFDGIRRSARLVVGNRRAVGGHLLVVFAGGVVFSGFYSGALGVAAVPFFPTVWVVDPTTTIPLTTALQESVLTLLLALVGTVLLVYSVVFYRSLLSVDSETAATRSTEADDGDAT